MRSFLTAAVLFIFSAASAQQTAITLDEWQNTGVGSKGKAPYRSEFISYSIRKEAENGDSKSNLNFLRLDPVAVTGNSSLKLVSQVDVPISWLNRELFLHVEGVPSFYLTVGDRRVAYAEDNRTPSEFNISPYVTDGLNTITLEVARGTGMELDAARSETPNLSVYLYSQPKIRIEDYMIDARPDSTGKQGIIDIKIALTNGYNYEESLKVGYDIYSPQGKLQHYDNRHVTISGQGRDTLEFREYIYGTPQNLWSAETPNLYYGMLIVEFEGMPKEYIPYRVGFGTTQVADGLILRNGKPVELKTARYNAAADAGATQTELKELKQRGINTVHTYYPQPLWFYDLCDELGLYVIDQANINPKGDGNDRSVDGTKANNHAWLGSYIDRTRSMFARVRNHTSIVGWSLGGDQGNGYNLYKTYQWLKANDTDRAVIYNDARGEWNSDMGTVPAMTAVEIMAQPAPDVKPATGRRR